MSEKCVTAQNSLADVTVLESRQFRKPVRVSLNNKRSDQSPSYCHYKIIHQSNVRRVRLGSRLEGYSPTRQEVMEARTWGSWSPWTISQEAERDERWCSTNFLLCFIQTFTYFPGFGHVCGHSCQGVCVEVREHLGGIGSPSPHMGLRDLTNAIRSGASFFTCYVISPAHFFPFVFGLVPQPTEWCYPYTGWVCLPESIHHRHVQRCVFYAFINTLQLTIKINNYRCGKINDSGNWKV